MVNLFTTIPEKEPRNIFKGETIVWKRTDIGVDYDPSSHSMVWEASLETNGSTRFSATVTESGTEYTFTLDNSNTANYTSGDYKWFLKVKGELIALYFGFIYLFNIYKSLFFFKFIIS